MTSLPPSTVVRDCSMLTEHLGIPVELQTMDRQAFYADMRSILFGWVSYGMDYFDPSNMHGDVWRTGGVIRGRTLNTMR